MTVYDLIGTPGEDVVFEGPQVQEFADHLDSLFPKDPHFGTAMRKARRIVGLPYGTGRTPPTTPATFGQFCGRTWSYEF